MPPILDGGKNMSLDKKLNVLLILTISSFAILFGIVIVGDILPHLQPTCAWIMTGIAVVYTAASLIFVLIAKKKDKRSKTMRNK